jgi:prolyl-tRNA synthetase
MYQSRYFLPILKEDPAEAQVVSHRLMLRAGMIRQLTSGIYNWLPLGLTVLRIIREELNKVGAIELLMPTIQPAELWQESGRYDGYGKEMLRVTDRHNRSMLYGPTNEEVITDLFRKNISSYKDLPKTLYQMQWKFRDEIRPRFGVMRGREFFMNDAYSFDTSSEAAKETYDLIYNTYLKIFKRLGLTAIPVRAETGAIGGSLSHEFHILSKTGESDIYYDVAFEKLMKSPDLNIEELHKCYAMADEMHKPEKCPISEDKLRTKKGIEVGHIFSLDTKYSEKMKASVMDKEGKPVHVHMGCFGLGVSRLIAAIIEASHDDNGIIWPKSVTPFDVSLINIKITDETCNTVSKSIYNKLSAAGVKVLYDDTKDSAGKKFATHDLIGSPWQLSIGPRGVKDELVELKNRATGEKEMLSEESAINKILE